MYRQSLRGGWSLLAGLAITVTAAAGCGHTLIREGEQQVPLETSRSAPAALGQVNAIVNEQGNTEFTVKVDHLAPPASLERGATNYVVWVKPLDESRPAQNVGALKVNLGERKGEYKGATPYRRFRLEITAEVDPTAQQPTTRPILSAQVAQRRR